MNPNSIAFAVVVGVIVLAALFMMDATGIRPGGLLLLLGFLPVALSGLAALLKGVDWDVALNPKSVPTELSRDEAEMIRDLEMLNQPATMGRSQTLRNGMNESDLMPMDL